MGFRNSSLESYKALGFFPKFSKSFKKLPNSSRTCEKPQILLKVSPKWEDGLSVEFYFINSLYYQ